MKKYLITSVAVAVLAGCASAPTGPRVLALPGSSKSSAQFRYDDNQCRQDAQARINPNAANNAGLRSAAVGTAIGTVAGAVIGGHQGAGVGAGMGLITGSMVGASESQYAGYDTQQQYDNAYVQCMYGRGHKVPVAGNNLQEAPRPTSPAPYPPPPPAGWQGG